MKLPLRLEVDDAQQNFSISFLVKGKDRKISLKEGDY